jgi:hypothetical protein
MSKYRLDDLIREGIKISDKIIADLVRRDDGQIKSCAYGAAQLGLEKNEDLSNTNDVISSLHNLHESLRLMSTTEVNDEHVPDSLSEYSPIGTVWTVYGIIYTMNDAVGVSRKAVAEYVTWLIDEKGYDLFVEIEENNEVEKEDRSDLDLDIQDDETEMEELLEYASNASSEEIATALSKVGVGHQFN